MKNGKEIMYASEDGNYRVTYDMWDLGLKYRVQMKDEYGHWKTIHWTDSALDALTVMKKSAREW